MYYSLRSKRFHASSSRTSGREQKKKRNDGGGGGERRIVFRFHSNFRAITRLETLATHAMCIKMNDLYRVTKSS